MNRSLDRLSKEKCRSYKGVDAIRVSYEAKLLNAVYDGLKKLTPEFQKVLKKMMYRYCSQDAPDDDETKYVKALTYAKLHPDMVEYLSEAAATPKEQRSRWSDEEERKNAQLWLQKMNRRVTQLLKDGKETTEDVKETVKELNTAFRHLKEELTPDLKTLLYRLVVRYGNSEESVLAYVRALASSGLDRDMIQFINDGIIPKIRDSKRLEKDAQKKRCDNWHKRMEHEHVEFGKYMKAFIETVGKLLHKTSDQEQQEVVREAEPILRDLKSIGKLAGQYKQALLAKCKDVLSHDKVASLML